MNHSVRRDPGHENLMATPAVMLGFHPDDSLVFIMMSSTRVRCCVRIDLTWFLDGYFPITEQLTRALAQDPDAGFVLLGFGTDEDLIELSMDQLSAALGEHLVLERYLHRGTSYVRLDDDREEFDFDFGSTKLAAEAVFSGIRIEKDRETAIAPVLRHVVPAVELELAALCDLASLDRQERLMLLEYLAEMERHLDAAESVMLATLLGDPDCAIALFQRLVDLNARRDTIADVVWARVAEARASSPLPVVVDCLAVLAAASWLTGRGAAQTCCLEQLVASGLKHPLGTLIADLHRAAVSPDQFRSEAWGQQRAEIRWDREGQWVRWAEDR